MVRGDMRLGVVLDELSCDPGKDQMQRPFIRMVAVTRDGDRIEPVSRTLEAQQVGPSRWHLGGTTVQMATPLGNLGPGHALILEVVHVKERRKGRESVRAWAAVRVDDVVQRSPDGSMTLTRGSMSLKLFAKPTDPTVNQKHMKLLLVPKPKKGQVPDFNNRLKVHLVAV